MGLVDVDLPVIPWQEPDAFPAVEHNVGIAVTLIVHAVGRIKRPPLGEGFLLQEKTVKEGGDVVGGREGDRETKRESERSRERREKEQRRD